jgi:hypothetical protein
MSVYKNNIFVCLIVIRGFGIWPVWWLSHEKANISVMFMCCPGALRMFISAIFVYLLAVQSSPLFT